MTRRSQAAKKTARKRYSKEFKDEALALSERLGVPAAAKELEAEYTKLKRMYADLALENRAMKVVSNMFHTFNEAVNNSV